MVLHIEDSLYPATLNFHDSQLPWWVAHTKPNQEKKLAKELKQYDVSHFLPLVEKKTRKKTKNPRIRPLFPGYVFFAGDHDARRIALETGRIANVISILDQAKMANELEQVYLALQSGFTIDPCQHIIKGEKYRLTTGPGMGLEGKVIIVKKKSRIVIEVESIGQSIMMEVNAEDLAVVEKGG
jgi:transcription antitermination factor NusG